MRIPVTRTLFTLALVGVTALVTSQVVSRPQEPDPAVMMEQWMKLAEPGPEHAALAALAGTWHQDSVFWPAPGAPPQRSSSVCETESIMGGRFLLQRIKGDAPIPGMPDFEGLGLYGYDNGQEKHFYAWVDNMGTLLMTGEGSADRTGKIITYLSEVPNPFGPGVMEFKSVVRQETDRKQVFEMHQKLPNGAWFKNMEILATRSR